METVSIPVAPLIEDAKTLTITELAEKYGVDYGDVYRILARFGVKARPSYTPITKEALRDVFAKPRTIHEAADLLHTTVGTVSNAIKKHRFFHGNKKPTVKNSFAGERGLIILAYIMAHPEESLASIGRRHGCTREYVRQVRECATRHGIITASEEPPQDSDDSDVTKTTE